MLDILEERQSKGEEVEAFKILPLLPLHLMPIWNGYRTLHNQRPQAFSGLAAIPFSEMTNWLDEYGHYERDDRDYWLTMFTDLDYAHRKYIIDNPPPPPLRGK